MTRALLATGLALAALPLGAQDWRTITQSRRTSGEAQLRVHVEHVAGNLRIRPAAAGQLFQLALRYDDDLFSPNVRYVASRSSLRVDLEGRNRRRGNVDWDENYQMLDLALAADVPLDLALHFGAAEAAIDLGGLTLNSLSIQTGASESRVTFDTPNPGACSRMELQVGAAEFTATRLGNARCERVSVEAGVGDLLLDFSGDLPDGFSGRVSVHMGLGGLEIRVPEDVGVQLSVRRFLASVERVGFVRGDDGSWITPNWGDATRKLTLDIRAALGGIEVIRVSSTPQ